MAAAWFNALADPEKARAGSAGTQPGERVHPIVVDAMREAGIDLVDCSSGGNVHDQRIALGPGYQVPFAEAIRREAGIPTAAVGLISEPVQAEQILSLGRADAVCLARAMLRVPYWPRHAAKALGSDFPWPDQYKRGEVGPLGR